MDAHELLVAGRNRLTEDTWRQGCDGYGRGTGRYCAQEAIHRPCGDKTPQPLFMEAFRALAQVIGGTDVPKWNDAPERTLAEVHAAYDGAIAATAPKPDVSFLDEVRVEPSGVS